MNGASPEPEKDAIRVPPPPPRVLDDGDGIAEVMIRTMASDIQSLGESGGLQARGETVAVAIRNPHAPATPKTSYVHIVLWTIITLAGLGFLLLIGYYFIPALVGGVIANDAN